MSEYQLVGHHVRLVWKDQRPGGGKSESTIFRGQILQSDTIGIWIWGRFFLEKPDTISVREFPKEKDVDMRMFFAPWTSIDSVEIIDETSKNFKIHQLVLARTPAAPSASAVAATAAATAAAGNSASSESHK